MGVFCMGTGNISNINITDAGFQSNVACLFKAFQGRAWKVGKMIQWMKSAEMQWVISEFINNEPFAHLSDNIHVICKARKDKACNFQPNPFLL